MRASLHSLVAIVALLIALPGVAAAQSGLDKAKAAGHVGEQSDGYLGLPPGAPDGANELADRINEGRAAHYSEIATKNGTSPTAVAALAGKKLIERAAAGEWVRDPDGNWTKKKK